MLHFAMIMVSEGRITARQIDRDMGEEEAAKELNLPSGQRCFLVIHLNIPPEDERTFNALKVLSGDDSSVTRLLRLLIVAGFIAGTDYPRK